jgi:hypothetical protein
VSFVALIKIINRMMIPPGFFQLCELRSIVMTNEAAERDKPR